MISQFEIVGVQRGTKILSSVFSKFGRPAAIRSSKSQSEKDEPEINIKSECQNLLDEDLIQLNTAGKYELTEKGEEHARKFENKLSKTVQTLESQLLSPIAAARNTVFIDIFLAILKLFAGFMSGSVGLLADGADAAVDTVSASLVWLGIKMKRELPGTLIILLMMFITGISVGYESVTSILEVLAGNLSAIARPDVVIITELIALIFAVILYIYQRYVGKRNGSLSLISQSVDSKNHVYVAITVIIGAIFSIYGMHFLDPFIGGVVAVIMLVDAVGLLKETISSMKGEELDLEKYEIPLERQWQISKLETFRSWILFSIKDEKISTREDLINELENTFKPKYVPILSEFKFSLGEGFDFTESFDTLINPLLEDNFLTTHKGEFIITDKGIKHISGLTRRVGYK